MYNQPIIVSKMCVQTIWFSSGCFFYNQAVDYNGGLLTLYKQVIRSFTTLKICRLSPLILVCSLFTQPLLLILLIYIKKG